MSSEAVEEEESSWIPLLPTDENNLKDETPLKALNGNTERIIACSISKVDKRIDRDVDPNPSQPPKKDSVRFERIGHQSKRECKNNVSSPHQLTSGKKSENGISIQAHLVDRPLDYFWQRLFINLLRQIWTLQIRKQLGIFLLLAGLSMRIFVLFTWCFMYSRSTIIFLMFFASLSYLDLFGLQDNLRKTWKKIRIWFRPPSSQKFQVDEGIDTTEIRRLSLLLFMVPSLLETRTFSFLSTINAEDNGWTTSSLYLYNFGVSVCILSAMVYLRRIRNLRFCEVSYYGLVILYGFSLAIAIVNYDSSKKNFRHVCVIAAPFFTATATLLLTYETDGFEWLSRTIRLIFRLSLRESFSSVSERVTTDDMLQLALLRWICDFWATNPASTDSKSKEDSNNRPPSQSSCQFKEKTEQNQHSANMNSSGGESCGGSFLKSSDIGWEDLQPMLITEIDHMKLEMDALQNGIQNNSVADSLNAVVATNKKDEHAIMALQSTLLSFNKDDRAQPAVMAYKRAVESFPPRKGTAVVISISRRCPAFIAMILHTLLLWNLDKLLMTSLILLPFLIVEYCRIIEWMGACQQSASTSSKSMNREQITDGCRIPVFLRNVDTMTILLSGDVEIESRPPPLLKVWFNILSSVAALEIGLTTARCVETTALAIEFTGNTVSLVKFGSELCKDGISCGIVTLAKELQSIYADRMSLSKRSLSDVTSTRYTGVLIRAIHSGKKLANKINELTDDKNLTPIAQPLIKFLSILTGGKINYERDEEAEKDVFTSVDSSNEKESDSVSKDNTKQKSEESKVIDVTDDWNTKENKMKKTSILLEGRNGSEKTPILYPFASTKGDLTSMSFTDDKDLSQVMEIIETLYDSALIDQEEKNGYVVKLSELQKEGRYDSRVLSVMKKNLTIILENGRMVSTMGDLHLSEDIHQQYDRNETPLPSSSSTVSTSTPDSYRAKASQKDGESVINPQKSRGEVSESCEQNNDILHLGVAALCIATTGLAMTISEKKKSTSKRHFIEREENERHQDKKEREESTAGETFEIADQISEDDWVPLIQ